MTERYVLYKRVSTTRQGVSGLGLEAQAIAISNFLAAGDRVSIGVHEEVESGRNDERPALKAALAQCRMTGARLLIGKLDRLARRVSFISTIMDSDVEFVACDFPMANRLTLHIIAAVAEHEAELISKRTKEGLAPIQAKFQRGETHTAKSGRVINSLGMANIGPHGRPDLGVAAIKLKADNFTQKVKPTVVALSRAGLPMSRIAAQLNDMEVPTSRKGSWTATSVRRVLRREVAA